MGKSKRNKQATQVQPGSQPKASPAARKVPIVPVTIGVVVVVIVIAIVAGGRAQDVTFVDGKASRTIATVDECASTSLPLTVPAGETPETVATAVFDALSKTTGVGLVTVYENDPRVDIEYCQSYSSDPTLREVLAPTGYLGTEIAPAGSVEP